MQLFAQLDQDLFAILEKLTIVVRICMANLIAQPAETRFQGIRQNSFFHFTQLQPHHLDPLSSDIAPTYLLLFYPESAAGKQTLEDSAKVVALSPTVGKQLVNLVRPRASRLATPWTTSFAVRKPDFHLILFPATNRSSSVANLVFLMPTLSAESTTIFSLKGSC